jgi:tetratricopeptide (TPR) repeat protein
MPDRFISFITVGLIFLATGCDTQAVVVRDRPALFNAGAARNLTLVQVTGRPDLEHLLRETFSQQAASSGWWNYTEQCAAGIALFPGAAPGQTVTGRRPGTGEIYVRLDAYDATVFPEKERHEKPNKSDKKKSDKKRKDDEKRGRVCVRFAATIVNSLGELLMDRREYTGTADGDIGTAYRRQWLVAQAAANGLSAFMQEITPRRVREGIALDKDSEDMHPIAVLIDQGQYAAAAAQLEQMRKLQPLRADLVFNLAVLTDARGSYEEALKIYDEALKLGYKPQYAKTREACLRRLGERDALGR